MSRPDSKDVFALKPGVLSWLRDQAYDFVYYDIGTGLDFVGDMFRGPSGYSESLHRSAKKHDQRHAPETPLTKTEQATFVEMLKRTPGEPQMAYWKRKKALLNTADKKDLVAQHAALQKTMAGRKQDLQILAEHSSFSASPQRGQRPTQAKTRRRQ